MAADRKRKRSRPEEIDSGTDEKSKDAIAPKRITRSPSRPVSNLLQVESMPRQRICEEIEEIFTKTAKSITSGDGFSFEIPSGDPQYDPINERFVLPNTRKIKREFCSQPSTSVITARVLSIILQVNRNPKTHITKRELYYIDPEVFEKQEKLDSALDDVSRILRCTRDSLNVVASSVKGIVVGCVSFYEDNDEIDCTKMGVGGKAIPHSIEFVSNMRIHDGAKFILLVEKEAAFMRLSEERFYKKYPCVIVTGKGHPDVATRQFLRYMKISSGLPVYGLVDCDPYAIHTLAVYRYGLKNMLYDSINLTTDDIIWLGVKPSDLPTYNISQRLPLSSEDIKTAKNLLKEDFMKENEAWSRELRQMLRTKEKVEIQALNYKNINFLLETYLPKEIAKLQAAREVVISPLVEDNDMTGGKKLNDIIIEFTTQPDEKTDISEVIQSMDHAKKDAKLEDKDVVKIIGDELIDFVQLSDLKIASDNYVHQVNKFALLIEHFTEKTRDLELELMHKIQDRCFSGRKLKRFFIPIVRLLLEKDALAKDTFIYWYHEGRQSPARQFFRNASKDFMGQL